MSNTSPPSGEPEYLGDADPATSGPDVPSPRRRLAPLAVVAGVVGAVAAGGWAALALMSDGGQPAEAVPADALAYVSVDLDPSAAQKVEALRVAGKFPALREKLGLDTDDDLRRWVFEESGLARCPGTDYDTDVAPWIGERAAFAVLPGGSRPHPIVTVAVTDEDAAASALARLVDCGPSARDAGFAVGAGHAVIAESGRVAEAALDAAGDEALADDPAFERWTSEAGEPGILTAYLAPEAPAQLSAMRGQLHGGGFAMGPVPGMGPGLGPPDGRGLAPGLGGSDELLARFTRDFEGLGAVVRFAEGTVEVEVAAGGVPTVSDPREVSGIRELPDTTGAGASVALGEEWLGEALEDLGAASGMPVDQLLAVAEARTGLDLPEDVETLLGDSASIAVDSDPVDGGTGSGPTIRGEDPTVLRAGVRVQGDAAEILPVLDKVRAALGPAGRMLVVETGQGTVAFGFNADYVAELARSGDLDAERTFQEALPERDRSSAAAFLDFEAGDGWLEQLAEEHAQRAEGKDATELRRNLEPLDALGASAWTDDGIQRGLLRLSTD